MCVVNSMKAYSVLLQAWCTTLQSGNSASHPTSTSMKSCTLVRFCWRYHPLHLTHTPEELANQVLCNSLGVDTRSRWCRALTFGHGIACQQHRVLRACGLLNHQPDVATALVFGFDEVGHPQLSIGVVLGGLYQSERGSSEGMSHMESTTTHQHQKPSTPSAQNPNPEPTLTLNSM